MLSKPSAYVELSPSFLGSQGSGKVGKKKSWSEKCVSSLNSCWSYCDVFCDGVCMAGPVTRPWSRASLLTSCDDMFNCLLTLCDKSSSHFVELKAMMVKFFYQKKRPVMASQSFWKKHLETFTKELSVSSSRWKELRTLYHLLGDVKTSHARKSFILSTLTTKLMI